MTDAPSNGRVDLRAVDADPTREDRVVAVALARIAADPSREPVVAAPTRYIRPAIAAAALLVAAAIGTVMVTEPPGTEDQRAATLASWAASQHVPTNGELLLAFQGYGAGR